MESNSKDTGIFLQQSEVFGFYKLYSNSIVPSYGTKQSACFDISAHLLDPSGIGREVRVVSDINSPYPQYATVINNNACISIPPQHTMLIPTGLISKIPNEYSLRIHLRSSVALKRGLYLPNGEGIIDSDYFDELFLMLRNGSKADVEISHGERICQGEWIPVHRPVISEIYNRPQQTTDRLGGFGSTGV